MTGTHCNNEDRKIRNAMKVMESYISHEIEIVLGENLGFTLFIYKDNRVHLINSGSHIERFNAVISRYEYNVDDDIKTVVRTTVDDLRANVDSLKNQLAEINCQKEFLINIAKRDKNSIRKLKFEIGLLGWLDE